MPVPPAALVVGGVVPAVFLPAQRPRRREEPALVEAGKDLGAEGVVPVLTLPAAAKPRPVAAATGRPDTTGAAHAAGS